MTKDIQAYLFDKMENGKDDLDELVVFQLEDDHVLVVEELNYLNEVKNPRRTYGLRGGDIYKDTRERQYKISYTTFLRYLVSLDKRERNGLIESSGGTLRGEGEELTFQKELTYPRENTEGVEIFEPFAKMEKLSFFRDKIPHFKMDYESRKSKKINNLIGVRYIDIVYDETVKREGERKEVTGEELKGYRVAIRVGKLGKESYRYQIGGGAYVPRLAREFEIIEHRKLNDEGQPVIESIEVNEVISRTIIGGESLTRTDLSQRVEDYLGKFKGQYEVVDYKEYLKDNLISDVLTEEEREQLRTNLTI